MMGYMPEGAKRCYGMTGERLLRAMERGETVEGRVTLCDHKYNLHVTFGEGLYGIIPREEGAIGIAEGITRDIALISRVGRPVCFTVTRFDTDSIGRTYAVLSRRNAQEMCRESILANKRCGDIINARVTHMENFGAFCDIGCGNIALLPIDAISVSRISHPRDRFRVGDNIRVIIKNIADDGKITLSHKELLGTWQENACKISQGQTVSGVVRSIENYGIFVELAPNLAGLAEIRDGNDERAADAVGKSAAVYIKNIIPDKMKIKLVLIDICDNEPPRPPLNYYIDCENVTHIDRWRYSPPSAQKLIESVFEVF